MFNRIRFTVLDLGIFRIKVGGAMVLGKLPVPGRLPYLIIARQGPIALAIGAGGASGAGFSLSLGDGPI